MRRHPIQLLVLIAVAAVFLLSFVTQEAQASHFRGGHLTWNKVPGSTNQVNIKFRHFWRTSPSSGRILDANGVQQHSIAAGPLVASGTDLSGAVWQIYENNVTITLKGPAPHTLEMFPSCCRISQLVNAPDDFWRIQTIIDLRDPDGAGPLTGQKGSSVSSLPPILQVAKGPNTIPIPVGDPDGSTIQCRMATVAESSILCTPGLTQSGSSCFGGPAATVTQDCKINFDATNKADKSKHAIQVAIFEGGLRTSLDIIMEVNGGLVNNDPPSCTLNGSVNNTGSVGQPFSISATATDPEGRDLRINHQGIPTGSTLTPSNGTVTSSPATATWSYTPQQPGETHAVTLTFTDDGNQQCQTSFTLSTPDNQPPNADAGVDQIIEQTGPTMAVILDGSGSSDPDNDPLTYTWSGDTSATGANPTVNLGPGVHNLTLTVSDGQASDTDTVQIIVQDTIAPVITVSDRTEEATGPTQGVDVSGDASATDAVGVTSLTNNSPGTFAASTTTAITWTACDAAGNCSTATQNVTIQDTIAPAITTQDLTVEATGPTTTADIASVTSATDVVGVTSLANNNAGPYPVGSTTVIWTACDAAGNCSTKTQIVTIVDSTPPDISNACLTDKLWPPNHKMVLVSTGSVSDIADPNATFSVAVTSNQPINGTGDGNTDPDWTVNSGSSDYEVSLRAERAGNLGQRDYTIVVSATDASGNTSQASCSASVPHDQGNNNSPAEKKGKK